MSRCFPYPPPGFQRTDHSDLLAKEKHQERKLKKERERKEGKERKDKDRNDDKCKEKKDRKERHKDKKREKAKYKDTSKTSDNRQTQERTHVHSGQKATVSIPKSVEVKDSTFAEERGKRIRYEQEGAVKRMVENISGQIQGVQHLGAAFIRETERGNGNMMVPKFISIEQGRVDEVGSIATTTVMQKERGNGNPTVTNFINKEQRKGDDNGGAWQLVDKGTHNHQYFPQLPVEKGNHNHQVLARSSVGGDAIKIISEKEKVTETDNGKGDRQRDRDQEKRNKGKDKIKDREKEKEKTDEGKINRHEDRDREKKSKGNDKNRVKVKEKDEKKRGEYDNNQKVPNKPQNIGETNRPDSQNCKTPFSQNKNECFSGNDGHGKKRRHTGKNGFLHEDAARPNKAPKQASSSQQPPENGKKLELDHVSSSPLKRHVTPNILKEEKVINNKQHKKNGFVQAHLNAVDLKPLAADTSAKSLVLPRPRHPDSKYLRQVYSVPQMEEWSEYNDQEWLFSGSNPQPKPEAGEPLWVWAKGLQIELVDVFALPYVIPY